MDRVNEVTRDALSIVGHIRFADEQTLGEPADLQRKLKTLVTDAMQKASALGYSQHDVQDIGYALTALIDEVVLLKGGALRDHWIANMLQLELFNTNVAGEEVFDRLQALFADPSRIEVLEIYYLALLFGFQGKYRIRGGELQLAEVTDRARDAIRRSARHQEMELAPRALPAGSLGPGIESNRRLFWAAVGALGFALIVYVGMALSLSSRVDDLSDTFQALSEEID